MSSRDSSPTPFGQQSASRPPRLVVGYDGSDSSRRALERVAGFAGPQTEVVVVAAVEPYPGSGVTIPANADEAEVRRRQADLVEAESLLEGFGVHASTRLLHGDPADALIDAAKDAELVVVGSRNLSRLQSFLLGSVSSRVVSGAPCDVLVVR
jgi:nucleotide-binding universal stress UspA family protein